MALRKDQRILIWASVVALACWVIAPLRVVLMPLVYFNTHIHEIAHAVASLITGGSVNSIQVFADGSGVTQTRGGANFIIASAGYIGSTVFGSLLVFAGKKAHPAKIALLITSIFLTLMSIVFLRGDMIGWLTAILWIAITGFCSYKLKGDSLRFATQFLGIQLCLTSFQAFSDLFILSSTGEAMTDATNMQKATMIPAAVWATLWVIISIVSLGFALLSTWKGEKQAQA